MHAGELLGLIAKLARDLLGYLPLTGGTLTGGLTAPGLTSTGAATVGTTLGVGGLASLGSTNHYPQVSIVGNVTVPTTVAISAGVGGVLMLIRGADATGVSFTKLYLVAVRISGGAAPDVASALISTAGSATPTFTFSNVAGFLNITAASNNAAWASAIG